jgi:hypothetical protein
VPPASLSETGKKLWNETVLDPDFVGFSPTVTRELLRSYCTLTEALENLESSVSGTRSANPQESTGELLDRLFGPTHQELAETKSRLFKPRGE